MALVKPSSKQTRFSVDNLSTVKLFVASCIALASIVLTPTNAHARPFDEVMDSGELTVFVYNDYAPYSWDDNGTHRGIDVEIAEKFGEALGIKINVLMRGADENIDDDLRINIWKGDLIHRKVADVMLHVPVDREVDVRNELAVITSPYFKEEMAIVVDKKKAPDVRHFGYFVSRPIATELDTASDFFLSNAFKGQLHPSIKRGRTFADASNLYLNGEVAALMASKAQAEWVMSQSPDIDSEVLQPPMPGIVRRDWPVGIAVKHDSRDLGYALGDVLTDLIESGEMARITQKYGVSYNEPER